MNDRKMDLGRWPVTIIEHGFSPSKSGTPQMFVAFQNEHGDEITWYSTMGMKSDGSVSEKALTYFVKDCRTMGFNPEDHGGDCSVLSPGGGVSLIGNQVSIVVEDEEYNGKAYRRVKWINSLNHRKELNPAESQDLFKKIRAAMHTQGLLGSDKKAPPPPRSDVADRPAPRRSESDVQHRAAVAAQAPPQGIDYDDIPF